MLVAAVVVGITSRHQLSAMQAAMNKAGRAHGPSAGATFTWERSPNRGSVVSSAPHHIRLNHANMQIYTR